MIERDAILEAVRTTGVFGDIAADGADRLTGRIRCIVQPHGCHRTRESRVDDTRLNVRDAIGRVDVDDARETIESQEHRAIGQCAAGQTSAGAARHKSHVFLGEESHHGNQLLACAWKHGEPRMCAITGQRIGVVSQQLGRPLFDPAVTDN